MCVSFKVETQRPDTAVRWCGVSSFKGYLSLFFLVRLIPKLPICLFSLLCSWSDAVLENCEPVITRLLKRLYLSLQNLDVLIFCVLNISLSSTWSLLVPSVTVLGLFLFFPLILCHGNCHKVEPLDFFFSSFFL